ncbi:MAG: putative toxin-antitoxin system toxin component, PIN family [Betaproteobacteria bacterium]|nr:putative toxin-antitoxin system toxin component, PIN family [Betaproteobacteria bacterium]
MTERRIVLDTNIWLDWLVFNDLSLLYLKKEVFERRAEIFIDAACEAELERVLAYDLARHTLDAAAQGTCLAECRRIARRIDAAAPEAERKLLPRCVDPDDQKFLELALAARAECLVTKDHKLLELAHRTKAFRILNPRAF